MKDDASQLDELDQYARLAALVAHHKVLGEGALERRGYPLDRYRSEHRRWTRAIEVSLVEGDTRLAERFGSEFARERARLRALPEEAEVLTPLPANASNTVAHPEVAPLADVDPDETLLPRPAKGPVLPFVPDAAATPPAPLPIAPREANTIDPDETHLVPSPFVAARTAPASFGEALTPTMVPDLTVDAYALLQAELRADGESEQAWRRVGVSSEAAKRALKERFFELFRRDPQAQADFQGRFRRYFEDMQRVGRGRP